MPGPVSDSYDPEFGTSSNAEDVRDAAQAVIDKISVRLGPLKNIVAVVHEEKVSPVVDVQLTEKDLRVIRFCLCRELDSL